MLYACFHKLPEYTIALWPFWGHFDEFNKLYVLHITYSITYYNDILIILMNVDHDLIMKKEDKNSALPHRKHVHNRLVQDSGNTC